MADDVEVKFGASIEGFNASMAQVRETLQGFTSPLRAVRDNLGEVAEAFVAAFAVEKIAEFAEKIAELGEQAQRTSEMLGLTVQEVTDLQFASAVTGGSSDGMTRALEQLERAMSDVHNTSSIQYAAFQSLGISTEFLKEHQNDLMGVLEQVSQRFSESADGPAKTAIAMAILGRSGAEMIPLLDKGAEGFAELKAKAEAAGVELTGPQAAAMAQSADNMNELGQALQGLGEAIFRIFEPAIDFIVKSLTQLVEWFTSSENSATALHAGLELIALGFDIIVAAIETLIEWFEELWTVAQGIITGIGAGLTSIGKAMGDAFNLNWGAIGDDLNTGWQKQVSNFQTTADTATRIAADTANNIKTMFEQQLGMTPPAAANSSGSPDDRDKQSLTPPGQNLHSGSGANDALDAARAKTDGEIQVLQAGLSRKQALLNSELQMHQITDAQYVQQSEEAVNEEYQQEVALLQKELQLNGLKLTQRQELLNKLEQLEQKHAADIQKIQLKSAQDAQKAWTSVGDAISSAVNSQISGLIKGTESIGQAMENIGLSLATTFLENALKSIVTSAAQAFAGTFAFLAPTMGPAAAGPAAASQAAVLGVAGSVGLASGTWGLPSDTVQQLHKDEMVIPAFQSDQFRTAIDALSRGGNGGGGGDTHNHFHGAILDGRELLRRLGEAKRLNPSLA